MILVSLGYLVAIIALTCALWLLFLLPFWIIANVATVEPISYFGMLNGLASLCCFMLAFMSASWPLSILYRRKVLGQNI